MFLSPNVRTYIQPLEIKTRDQIWMA